MKKIIIFFLFLFPIYLSAQTESKDFNHVKFEKYCRDNAVSYIIVPNEKKEINFSGELLSQENNSKSSYISYGVILKENETQYFKLTGSDKILAVQSKYRMRLDFLKTKK